MDKKEAQYKAICNKKSPTEKSEEEDEDVVEGKHKMTAMKKGKKEDK